MNAFALTRTRLPLIFRFDRLGPRVLATSIDFPDFEGRGFQSLSRMTRYPSSLVTFISCSFCDGSWVVRSSPPESAWSLEGSGVPVAQLPALGYRAREGGLFERSECSG